MAKAKKTKQVVHPPNKWIVVRRSKVHGNGCFARRDIPKGTRIIEYLGERISHKEADRRYEGSDVNDNHTFLFIADRKTVIDATTGGNEARWINHHCDGNCESETEKGRVFVDAIKDMKKGEELGYDYQIGRDKERSAQCGRDLRLSLRLAQVPWFDAVAVVEGVPQAAGGAQACSGEEEGGSKAKAGKAQRQGRAQQGQASGMKLSAVVAVSDNDVIGRDNAIPWHQPADLAYFKRVTMGKPILMGRKTWDSIGKPLPGRRNIVLSRSGFTAPGADVVRTLDEACELAAGAPEMMVIGGAKIFELAMPRMDHVHLTRVHCVVDGDVFLPPLHARRVAGDLPRGAPGRRTQCLRDDVHRAGAGKGCSRELTRSCAIRAVASAVAVSSVRICCWMRPRCSASGVGDVVAKHHHGVARHEPLRVREFQLQ